MTLPTIDALSPEDLLDYVEARLRASREAISREICEVPPPIPACDANVNRLLEDRARISDELQAWSKLRLQGATTEALRRFVAVSRGLDAASRDAVLELLGRTEAGAIAAAAPRR